MDGVQRHDDGSEAEEAPGSPVRRDLLRKAAVAAATSGVVWVAPRIEGFSLVPDYASAGTGGPCGVRLQFNTPGTGAFTDRFQGTSYNTGTPVVPVTGSGDSANVATLSAPLGVAGNVAANIGPVNADGDSVAMSVTFNIDPPFNKCRVTGGDYNVTNTWYDGKTGSIVLSPSSGGTTPNPAPGVFTVNATLPKQSGNVYKVGQFWVDVCCT